MLKDKKILAVIVVLAVICVAAVLIFSGVITTDIGTEEATTEEATTASYDISSLSLLEDESDPYLPTFIDGVYYKLTTDGEVSFYTLDEETLAFTSVDATGTVSFTVTLSEQDISATVTYIEYNDETAGYGLYTTAISGDTGSLYRYVFFAIRDINSVIASSSSYYLLLIDTTEDDFRNADKIWEEQYTLSKSSSATTRILSEANRYVGLDGTKRADYSIMTDYMIDDLETKVYFLSGRHYSEGSGSYDLMSEGSSGNNLDNVLIAENVIGYYFTHTDDGILYLTENDEGYLELTIVDADEPVVTFTATADEVLVYDDYFYFTTGEIYDVENDTTYTLNSGLDGFTADLFVCDGEVAFLRGYLSDGNAAIVLLTLETGEYTLYANEEFTNVINPVILSNGTVIFTIIDEDNDTYSLYSID